MTWREWLAVYTFVVTTLLIYLKVRRYVREH